MNGLAALGCAVSVLTVVLALGVHGSSGARSARILLDVVSQASLAGLVVLLVATILTGNSELAVLVCALGGALYWVMARRRRLLAQRLRDSRLRIYHRRHELAVARRRAALGAPKDRRPA